MEPNYDNYSLDELIDALSQLDENAFPQRAARLQQLIGEKHRQQSQLVAERESTLSKQAKKAPFEFSGNGGDYFKLWIVNLLLSIVTLGIYSAWAKVRNNQYLLGHTKLEGHSFRYLAKPMQILKGRLIAVAVLIAFSVLSQFFPIAGMLFSLALLVATPWLILQGMRFSMRMTAYKNVRFSFEGSYFGLLATFVLLPIVGAFTLYLAMPWVFKKMDQYLYSHTTYGGKRFEVNTSSGSYYKASFAGLGLGFVLFIALFTVLGVGEGFASFNAEGEPDFQLIPILMFYAGAFLVSFMVRALYQSIVLNHLIGETQIEGVVTFKPEIKTGSYMRMMTINALMLACTLGLAYPVTQVRKLKYMTNAIGVMLLPGADALTNTVGEGDSAFGEEAAGLFDLDLSIT
ncbi:YjgN family protein [Ferrimonas futtsuensis]|uniref:YjgN family protein n=1 Tax=Ferrimonas futtsuensis TaxID=364764 RepID=UPI000425E929|nr:YjgN family protein [Ferrimonas futtsuensis]